MNAQGSKGGFGVMELLVAMLATSLLVLAVGSMMVFAWKGWVQSAASVEMQRDVSLAMRTIATEIRRTPMANITDGASLVCNNSAGTITVSRSGRDLNLRVGATASVLLVRDIATAFSTKKNNANGSVTVSLNLATGSDVSAIQMIVYSRN